MAKYWDFDVINETVPIESVLDLLGIEKIQGKYRLRPEDDHASASIHPQRKYGNTIHDFGDGNNFTPLSLTMYWKGLDRIEASRYLGEAFGVPPKYTDETLDENINKMADYEWRAIGLYPDMASKNMDLNPMVDGLHSTRQRSRRYGMSMSELRDKANELRESGADVDDDVKTYEQILRARAVPFVFEMRYEYFREMYDDFQLAKAINSDWELDKMFAVHQDSYKKLADQLTKVEFTLRKVLEGTKVSYPFRRYRPDVDFLKVINGELAFEIGRYSRFDVSQAAYREYSQVFDTVVSLGDYYRLSRNGLEDVMHGAMQQGDKVRIYFKATDAGKVTYLTRALRGKERNLAEILSQDMGKDSFEEKEASDSRGVKMASAPRMQSVDEPEAKNEKDEGGFGGRSVQANGKP